MHFHSNARLRECSCSLKYTNDYRLLKIQEYTLVYSIKIEKYDTAMSINFEMSAVRSGTFLGG